MAPELIGIVEFLNRTKTRATYKAVGEAANVPPQSVGGRLGEKCPLASWVVSAKVGLPTGYFASQMHADLKANDEIIKSGEELIRRMKRG